jgi:hypothetical protein
MASISSDWTFINLISLYHEKIICQEKRVVFFAEKKGVSFFSRKGFPETPFLILKMYPRADILSLVKTLGVRGNDEEKVNKNFLQGGTIIRSVWV